MKFGELISRAEDEILQQLLGAPVVRLLRLIDSSMAKPSSLRKLLLDLYTPSALLRDIRARQALLELLPRDTAKELLESLQIADTSDPYSKLLSLRLVKGSTLENRLFSFFDEIPASEIKYEESPQQTQINGEYELFEHQRNASREVKEFLSTDRKRVLLHMPTGSGKTRTAMHVIADQLRINEPSIVVWLAYSDELCEQAAVEFQEAWNHLGNRPIGLFRFWGTRDLNLDEARDGFIVAGLSKTYSYARNSVEFIATLADRCSLVVIDEAHQAIAHTYSLILDVLVEKQLKTGLLGLSATPGRTWNDVDQDQQLANFFHRQKATLRISGYPNPIDYLIDQGYLARPRFDSLFFEPGYKLSSTDLASLEESLDIPSRILESLAENEQRNLLIIRRLDDLLKSHDRIIIFAASVRHADLLAAVLRARGVVAASITGETPPLERARIISQYRGSYPDPIVMCNYGVLTSGFDAPRTSAAVIARPTKSLVLYSQMAGRALRGPRAGGNTEAEIVTVIDTHLPGFGNLTETFFNWEDVWI